MSGTIEPKITDRIYLDTDVFIEAFEGRGRLRVLLQSFLPMEPVRIPQRLVTSELTLSELLVRPLELQRDDLINVYDNWMITNPYLEIVPIDRGVLFKAALLRAKSKSLKLPDAIHLTTAQEMNCRYFLTNDDRIKGPHGVEILALDEINIEAFLNGVANATF
ncbi:MAG: PIN domain-containing protein [Alphaproteobacteria bacterium]